MPRDHRFTRILEEARRQGAVYGYSSSSQLESWDCFMHVLKRSATPGGDVLFEAWRGLSMKAIEYATAVFWQQFWLFRAAKIEAELV